MRLCLAVISAGFHSILACMGLCRFLLLSQANSVRLRCKLHAGVRSGFWNREHRLLTKVGVSEKRGCFIPQEELLEMISSLRRRPCSSRGTRTTSGQMWSFTQKSVLDFLGPVGSCWAGCGQLPAPHSSVLLRFESAYIEFTVYARRLGAATF